MALMSLRHFVTNLVVCFESLPIWKTEMCPSFNILTDVWRFCFSISLPDAISWSALVCLKTPTKCGLRFYLLQIASSQDDFLSSEFDAQISWCANFAQKHALPVPENGLPKNEPDQWRHTILFLKSWLISWNFSQNVTQRVTESLPYIHAFARVNLKKSWHDHSFSWSFCLEVSQSLSHHLNIWQVGTILIILTIISSIIKKKTFNLI